jgi:hypothetical protein
MATRENAFVLVGLSPVYTSPRFGSTKSGESLSKMTFVDRDVVVVVHRDGKTDGPSPCFQSTSLRSLVVSLHDFTSINGGTDMAACVI